MIAAVIVAVGVMFVASGPVAKFVADHPTTKMLALAFLLLIGVTLVADGLGFHIPKGYIYAAMAFSVLVEAVNIFAKSRKRKATRRQAAARLDRRYGSVYGATGLQRHRARAAVLPRQRSSAPSRRRTRREPSPGQNRHRASPRRPR